MRRSEPIDWRNWLLLAWASWFGLLYARMIVVARLPGLARWMGAVMISGPWRDLG